MAKAEITLVFFNKREIKCLAPFDCANASQLGSESRDTLWNILHFTASPPSPPLSRPPTQGNCERITTHPHTPPFPYTPSYFTQRRSTLSSRSRVAPECPQYFIFYGHFSTFSLYIRRDNDAYTYSSVTPLLHTTRLDWIVGTECI